MSKNFSLEESILKDCRKNISNFHNMSDVEIYEWMCDNFVCRDYELLRRCSFVIFKESRNS